ncbi:MAG: DUF2958 domain-containing protein [Planctomycetota bacterium]
MTGLLPGSVRGTLPKLYATEHESDPLLRVKLFTPWTNWTWWIAEFDGEDICFGLVQGFETELGYFSLKELEAIRGPGGLKIERDLHFEPVHLKTIRDSLDHRGTHPTLPYTGRDR